MPHKISFHVIHASGSDTGVSLHDLEVHSPLVRGWQSPRFCLYPQEIVVQLADKTRIRKIQLLAHQYFIPTKIEIYIGSLPPDHVTTLHGTRYKRLGYVGMSDNSKTGYKARELKSVYVDAVGQYLRLVVHKNHVNKYNVYNQVNLIAINVIGDEITSEEDMKLFEEDDSKHKVNQVIKEFMPEGYFTEESSHANNENDSALLGIVKRKDYISPMDDLAFDMYQDPEVAQILRKLDGRKNEAVMQEQYDLAKELKQAIADLQKVGEKLGRYEVEKRQAIETEDYGLAKIKKIQMEEYRLQIYQQLALNDLLKLSKSGENDAPMKDEPLRNNPAQVRTSSPLSTGQTASNNSVPTTIVDRPLPTLKTQNDVPEARPSKPDQDDMAEKDEALSDSMTTGGIPFDHAEPMNDNALRQAATAIDVFGQELVAKLFSKSWTFREEALAEIKHKLENETETTNKDEMRNVLKALTYVSSKGLNDKVLAVYMSALSLLRFLYEDWIPKHKPPKSDTIHSLEVLTPDLMARIGDMNARLKAANIDFIIEVAMYKEVRPLHCVPHYFVTPFQGTTQAKIAVTRVHIVEKLLKELGIEKHSGLGVGNVMAFAKRALEHTAGEVREASVHLIIELYRLKAAAVRSHLPPEDDPKTMKNPLYCKIFDGMDRADGKPTKAERKAKAQSEKTLEKREKQAEIEELRHQLSDLRAAATAQGKNPEDLGGQSGGKLTKTAHKDQLPKTMPRAPSIAEQSDFGGDIDKQCIFCGEEDRNFKDEGLDMHYWKYCPVLKRCHSCKQVIEISALNNHLLTECEGRANQAKCPRCTETHERNEIERYVKDKICQAAKPGMSKCPLCHVNIAAEDKDSNWRKHLMGSGKDACPQNPRREPAIKRVKDNSEAASDKNKLNPHKAPEPTTQRRIPTKDKKVKSRIQIP